MAEDFKKDIDTRTDEQKAEEKARVWLDTVDKANRYYKDWSNKFKCDTMEQYYYGFQHGEVITSNARYEPYVINLIFSTIEIKKPTLLFENPSFKVKPKPVRSEFDFEGSVERAKLRQDALNSIVSDSDQEFGDEFELFIVDAFFRFGIMEIDYSADWIDNPNAGMPILDSDNNPYFDEEKNVIKEPSKLPENEKVYFKRIPAWRFRVGGTDGNTFKKCRWVGYYDYVRLEDLKEDKNLKYVDDLDISFKNTEVDTGVDEAFPPEMESDLKAGKLGLVWHIWDLRAKKKLLILQQNCRIIKEDSFKKLPLIALKFVQKLRGWYPVPLVFNWKSPQDEYNEAREQQRVHRRRSKRVWAYRDGTFADDGEMDKAEQGPDGTWIKTQTNPNESIAPLPMTPLDPVVAQSEMVSKDDLNVISATSSEQRGQSDRTTATQATIIDSRTKLRETRMRVQVANILKLMGTQVLSILQNKMALPFWVKVKTNPNDENFLQEFKETQELWKEMRAEDFGDEEDFEVDISVDSISPIDNEEQKQNFLGFLATITQYPQIAFDPILVREAAYRNGYRNEKVIQRMAQMAQLAALGQLEQAKGALVQAGMTPPGAEGSNAAQTRIAQMTPPSNEQVINQLNGQL